jgi:hypothetical protein
MPSERGQSRARLAGLLLDTLEFGAPANQKAMGISVVAGRVSKYISELAENILNNPSKPANELIEKWIDGAKAVRPGGTIRHNASVMYHSENRTDFESRVLALYRSLDGPVIERTTVVTKAGLKRVQSGSTRALRPAEYLNLIERARALLAHVALRDAEMKARVVAAPGRYNDRIRKSFAEDDIGSSMKRLIQKIARRNIALTRA